jgi:mono/diheme cytochrome c family protein
MRFALILFLCAPVIASENNDPVFTVQGNGKALVYHRSELLKSKHLKSVVITDDPHYPGRSIVFQAIPVGALFDSISIPKNSTVQFTASDGFSGTVDSARFFNGSQNEAHAFLAVESPEHQWLAARENDPKDLGPFYLVWENAKASHIVGEEWPYELVKFELKESAEVEFPHLQPDTKVSANDPVRQGQKVFMQNCFSCHTLNREGTSHMGPDLNVPYNPVEYFKGDFFEKYVRNVEAVHVWPENKMSRFPKEVLSDTDFKNLKVYLAYMSKHKVSP